MEKRTILVGEKMKGMRVRAVHKNKIRVKIDGDIMYIGNKPKLVVDLKNQQNYIEMKDRKIAYNREVLFSKDLLEGKREQVFQTALNRYYHQACEVATGMEFAEKYRAKANTKIREVK